MPANFRLYNTLSKEIENFQPLVPGEIKLYVCGVTVYDHAHVGHGRAMVVFDAFVRYLRYRGWKVRFVRNFTDVDDKIINRAAERGEEPMALAQRYIEAFTEDAANLGLIEPDEEPRVSENIEGIIEMAAKLIDKGNAYVEEGTVWFSVDSFPEYGKLSRQKVDQLRSADDAAGKRSGADFALWKATKPGEPAWPSPWGPGRPGWHIECSAMTKNSLGEQLDIHGGGLDLVFPHHENEIAQSECATGKQYARYWMHNGLLTMKGGQKMGKSLGNVINIGDALEEYPAEAVRFYLLQNQYRSPLPWSGGELVKSLSMVARIYEAKEAALQMKGQEKASDVVQSLGQDAAAVLELGEAFQTKMHQALDEDFNTSLAIGHLMELSRAINRFAGHKKARKRGGPVVAVALEAFASMSQAIGLAGCDPVEFQAEVKAKRLKAMGLERQEIDDALARRLDARTRKDWTASDSIRDELSAKGILVMDTPAGMEWRVQL